MRRNEDLDALRGLMLVSMTLTHLPTAVSSWANQMFGYVSNAEGFVFLSAYLVGRIYGRDAGRSWRGTAVPVWRRALKIYRYHLATLLFACTVGAGIALYGHRPALANLLGFYLQTPTPALLDGLLLIYRPSLLDILPMYILFMLITPALLHCGARRGWAMLLGASVLIWLAALAGLRGLLHDGFNAVSPLPLPPLRHLGAFNLYAWQLLWIFGLWLGQKHLHDPALFQRLPRRLTLTAAALAGALLVTRYVVGPPAAGAPAWFVFAVQKWTLGPLRMADFTLLTLFCARYGSVLLGWLPTAPLQLLGRASLQVFSAHVVLCLLMLGLIREDGHRLQPSTQLAVIVVTFIGLFAAAAYEQRKCSPRLPHAVLPQGQA